MTMWGFREDTARQARLYWFQDGQVDANDVLCRHDSAH